tara:strand:- start:3550 stop:4452 length:903 start_codon:yes stop_codon:yes gene_type:complete
MAVGNGMGIGIPMVNLGLGGGGGGGASFLLDDYPNTAGHSYSLRQLSSTVTNVVRVRRSSDNTEQDFTAAEITDGTLATFCGGGEGFVAKWYDQSNSSDVLNFTALQQPKIFVEDGVGGYEVSLENGKPCMVFDGVDDSLQVLLGLPYVSSYYLFAVNTWVSSPEEGDGYMYGLADQPFTPVVGDNSFRWDGTEARMRGFQSDLSIIKLGSFPQSLYYARQAVGAIGSLGSTLKINTTQYPVFGATANGSTSVNTIHLGESGEGGLNGNIKLQEFILYFADPGLDATAIESNINTHYSIY